MGEPVRIFTPSAAQQVLAGELRRYNVWVCHRGLGKTMLGLHLLLRAITERDAAGERVRMAYVTDLRVNADSKAWVPYLEPVLSLVPQLRPDRGDLTLTWPGGSDLSLFGSREDEERLRGWHGHGVVFDEYALVPPTLWQLVVLPALARHDGGAVFMGTPKGRNHFHALYHEHQANPDWRCVTLRASESGVYDAAKLAELRAEMTPEQYAQEYECSWDTPMQGAVYGAELVAARAAGRIREFAYDPALPVETWWDLGGYDATAVWFSQQVDREVRLIDYAEDTRKDLNYWAKFVQTKPYTYSRHHLPHDAGAERLEAGLVSMEAQLNKLGMRPTKVHPPQPVLVGVQQARLFFHRCWFRTPECARGLEALESYHYEWDRRRNVAKDDPDHDWSSHGADAFRLMASHLRRDVLRPAPAYATSTGNPITYQARPPAGFAKSSLSRR